MSPCESEESPVGQGELPSLEINLINLLVISFFDHLIIEGTAQGPESDISDLGLIRFLTARVHGSSHLVSLRNVSIDGMRFEIFRTLSKIRPRKSESFISLKMVPLFIASCKNRASSI